MAGEGRTILLIDDNEIDVEINKKLLYKGGCEDHVVARTSAKEGLKFIEECEDMASLPSLILLDIYMPEMDGFEFLEKFQQYSEILVKQCQIMMLSSSRDELDLNRALAHPLVSKVIKKPLDPQEVIGVLG